MDVQKNKSVDLIIKNGYILTLNEKREIFKKGNIVIKDGYVIYIGKDNDILGEYKAKKIIDAKNALIHPGLVDAHAHTTMNLARGWVPDYFSNEDMFNYFEDIFL